MNLMISHTEGGRIRNRVTVPEKMLLRGSGDHETSIYVSMTSGKPGRIRLLKMLIGGNTITICE